MKDNYLLFVTIIGLLIFSNSFGQSSALTISPIVFNCSDLNPDIITSEVELCIPGGYVTLEAQPSPVGTDVYWYDSETTEEPISKEGMLDVGYVGESTSYWVTELRIEGEVQTELGKSISDAGSGGYGPPAGGNGLQFTANEAFTLFSVKVLSIGSGGDVEIVLREDNHNGQILESKTVTVVGGGSGSNPVPEELELAFEIPEAGRYYISAANGPPMVRDTRDTGFPYSLGKYGQITSGNHGSGSNNAYYFFFDWKIGVENLICESDRKEVKINVVNNFPAPPKINSPYIFCGSEEFTLKDIEGNNEENLQWYDKRGGAISDTTKVQNAKTYYVAVGDVSVGGCLSDIVPVTTLIWDISDQPEADTEQGFKPGDVLTSLKVNGENLRWYADADKKKELPSDIELVDETTYYVTQTKSGFCESEIFAITVFEMLGVENQRFEKLIYGPNPIDKTLYVNNPRGIETIGIYDFSGKKIWTSRAYNGDTEVELDFSKYPSGSYFIKIEVDGHRKSFQTIKK